MNILIAYDGSTSADAAINDLAAAGLPPTANAVVISVAEVWLPPENLQSVDEVTSSIYIHDIVEAHRREAREAVAQAQTFAERARDSVLSHFPSWDVKAVGASGSPAWEVLNMADELNADLIVVGSHGRSAIGRFFLGSVSQKILTEAHCSVRIGRGQVEVEPEPAYIVVGFDGSQGANAAVRSVAARKWPAGSRAKLLAVFEPLRPTVIGHLVPPVTGWTDEENESVKTALGKLAADALQQLRSAGLEADLEMIQGDPKRVIVEMSEAWHADSIFMGANRYGSRVERFLLGSVSAAVAARAHCSVEVVRSVQK